MFNPIYMKDVNLIFGDVATGTDYKIELRSVTLTPDSNVTRIKTLDPSGQFSNVDAAEWSLDLGYLGGSYDTADAKTSLQDYLLAQAGNKLPFAFAPKAGGAGYQGTVTFLPGPIGGDQGSFSEQSVSLPIDGQPAPWTGVAPPAAWQATHAYNLDDEVSVAGGVLKCTTAGTSGTTEPVAPASVGQTVVDGDVVWTRVA